MKVCTKSLLTGKLGFEVAMSRKFLVVDDSSEFSFLLSSLFKFHKIDVDSETNPLKALEKLENVKYDLIVADYMMNEMDGLELIREMRKTTKNEATEGVLISAKKLDTNELKMVHDLKLTYVMKPIMPNDLYKKIMDLLDSE